MRFERLDLVRYGGFADRALEFGDGSPDLHLIVGPNEAGKSTLLAAIEDLLFGIPAQTPQGWRFEYGELRLRAVLEAGGQRLDATRRKGNRNTLLDQLGGPLADDVLVPFVGAIDRQAFARMYGLDHAKLRSGGQAILEGKDDAARTLFEAGSGIASVGLLLKDLEAKAGELFRPSASKPQINDMLRRRSDLQRQVREATLADTRLVELREGASLAQAALNGLIEEARDLERRANAVERVTRTRAPLNRLASARREIEALGETPRLPAGAAETLARARAELTTAAELEASYDEDLRIAREAIAGVAPPPAILEAREAIEALNERRAAIEKAQGDLARREAELEEIERRIAEAGRDAGLGAAAAVPSEAWMRRAGRHLEEARALQQRARRLEADEAALGREQDAQRARLAAAPAPVELAELRAALSEAPADAEDQIGGAQAEVGRLSARAERSRVALSWTGSGEALARACLPSSAEVASLARQSDEAREARRVALQEAEAAGREAAELSHRIALLSAGAPLPTPEAVAGAREARDAMVADIMGRLTGPRRDDDGQCGERLTRLVAEADQIADRRDAETQRLVEFARAGETLAAAHERRARTEAAAADRQGQEETLASEWRARLTTAGLPEALSLAGFEAWRSDRERALEHYEAQAEALGKLDLLERRLGRIHERLGAALAAIGSPTPAPDGMDARRRTAQAALGALETQQKDLAVLRSRQSDLDQRGEALTRERKDVELVGRALEASGEALCAEAGIASGPGSLERAHDGLGPIVADVVARAGLTRQVDAIERDSRAFETDAAALAVRLGRQGDAPTIDVVRAWAVELAEALRDSERLAQSAAAIDRFLAARRDAERRRLLASAEIDALAGAAGVPDSALLEGAIEAAEAAKAARAREAEALRELETAGEGMSVEALEAESLALPPEDAAAERARLSARRGEIAHERDAQVRRLFEAQGMLAETESSAEAAEAQQRLSELRSELAARSQRYVELTAGAALLRWMIDRHRATTQAPLLARAGALFRLVTASAYGRLLIDYGEDDRARIVAERADGARVGAEGLSEGTRDQLYLALRLGALQERSGGALPLVCDDLLVTSDDVRAASMLKVLRAAAETMQVLVFTHHEHLIGVARDALGADAFTLHRLAPTALEAAA